MLCGGPRWRPPVVGLPLRVVTAFEWTHDHPVGEIGLGRSYRDIMLDESRRLLREAAAVAARAADGLEVEQQLIVGFPIPVPRSPSVPSWS
jgi:hypothetical protein